MGRSVRRIFNAITGFDVVRWSGMHTDASALSEAIRKFRVDCVLDVGANEGQFGQKLRDLGYTGPIHSFEPVSAAFSELTHAREGDNNWHAHKLAVGEQAGDAEINVSAASIFSSFLPLSNFAKANWESSRVAGVEKVRVEPLDSVQGLDPFNSILLKSDTQGFDLQVIRGASKLLERVPLVYMEVSFRNVYEGSPGFEETIRFMAERRFHPSAMFPVTRAADFTLTEVDVLFAKR